MTNSLLVAVCHTLSMVLGQGMLTFRTKASQGPRGGVIYTPAHCKVASRCFDFACNQPIALALFSHKFLSDRVSSERSPGPG